MGEASLPQVEIDGRHPLPEIQQARRRCAWRCVDFPAPPFSLPSTTTCADAGRLLLACTNMNATSPQATSSSYRAKRSWPAAWMPSRLRPSGGRHPRRTLLQRTGGGARACVFESSPPVAIDEIGLLPFPPVSAARPARHSSSPALPASISLDRRAQPFERVGDAHDLARDVGDALAQHGIGHALRRPGRLDLSLQDRHVVLAAWCIPRRDCASCSSSAAFSAVSFSIAAAWRRSDLGELVARVDHGHEVGQRGLLVGQPALDLLQRAGLVGELDLDDVQLPRRAPFPWLRAPARPPIVRRTPS